MKLAEKRAASKIKKDEEEERERKIEAGEIILTPEEREKYDKKKLKKIEKAA